MSGLLRFSKVPEGLLLPSGGGRGRHGLNATVPTQARVRARLRYGVHCPAVPGGEEVDGRLYRADFGVGEHVAERVFQDSSPPGGGPGMADVLVLDVLDTHGDARRCPLTRAAVMPRSNRVYRRRGDSISTVFGVFAVVLVWVVTVAQEP